METKHYGNYRAKVVNDRDPKRCGRVLVFIPDIMLASHIDSTKAGLWARPANNPVGGRNLEGDSSHHFMGSSYTPKKGSWVWIFFECGNINRPYYFGAVEVEQPADGPCVLPECQSGDYTKKWVIFKSPEGRSIVISDDPGDARIEMSGKKASMGPPPHGDADSVYKIDGNQTTILFDEKAGREKILIRTRLGDYIHIDIAEQQLQAYFKNDIILKTDGNLHFTVGKDINIKAKNIHTESTLDTTRKAGTDIKDTSGAEFHVESGANMYVTSKAEHHTKAAGPINRDGTAIADQSGAAQPAEPAEDVTTVPPEGNRQT